MTTINAATIYAEVLAHRLALAQTIADLEPDYLPAYARLAGTGTELYLSDVVKRAIPSQITIKTSARGTMRIANTLYRLDAFAAIVKSKAAIFGGGFAKTERKAKPLVTWSTHAVKVACEAMQDNDYAGALQVAEEKLGAFFVVAPVHMYNKDKPRAQLLIAPMAVDGMPDNFVSARIINGVYQVFDLASGLTVESGEKTRSKAEATAITKWAAITPEKQAQILENAEPRNADEARAQWMAEYKLSNASEIKRFVILTEEQKEAFEAAEAARIEREKLEKLAQIAETMRAYRKSIPEVAVMADRAKRLISAKARRAERQKAAARSRAYDAVMQANSSKAAMLATVDAPDSAIDAHIETLAAQDVAQVVATAQAAPLSKVDSFLQSSGFTPTGKGQAKRKLEARVSFENSSIAVHELVSVLMIRGAKLHAWKEDKIKALSKKQELKATIYEYLQHEKKIDAGGTKTVYAIGDHFAGATEYAYAQYLQIQAIEPAIEAELAIVCEGEASKGKTVVMGSATTSSPADRLAPKVTVRYFDENEQEESKESHYAAISASNTPIAPVPLAQVAIETVADSAPDFEAAMQAAYENRCITTYGRINQNDCFQFAKSGIVFIKCAGGYRPGRGGELATCGAGEAVWSYDPCMLQSIEPGAQAAEHADPVQPAPRPAVSNDGLSHRCPSDNKQKAAGKSGAWTAELYKNAADAFVLQFMGLICGLSWTFYSTASERMRALQVMGREADQAGVRDSSPALQAPANESEPTSPVAVSSASPATIEPAESIADTGVGGAARSNLESSPAFKRAKPFNLDPRELLTDGVQASQLVGLGVNYTGDMANASGRGAITEATDTRSEKWGALRIVCTLEDGRVINTEPYYFTASLRPILQFNAKRHGAPYLAELATAAMLKRSSESSAAELAKQAKAQALAALPLEFPYLQQGGKLTGCTLAAANIRTMLKRAFPGVKFSVKSSSYSMGNSIHVSWTDGATDDQVSEITGLFSGGNFDAMTDSYDYSSGAFTDLFGKSKYINTRRELSDKLIQAAIEKHYQGSADAPGVSDYRNHTGPLSWENNSELHWFNQTLKSTTI